MARVAEWERLSTAREPVGWMIAGLQGAVESSVAEELREPDDEEKSFYGALAEVTAFFVRREPLDVPYDADQGFVLMWTIPGIGGEVRALLRDKTLSMVLQRDGQGLKAPPARSRARPWRTSNESGSTASSFAASRSSSETTTSERSLRDAGALWDPAPAPRGQDRGPWVALTPMEETI